MWSADVLAIHLASYGKWHFYLRSDGHTLPNFDGFLSFFLVCCFPSYLRCNCLHMLNTFYLGLTVIRYQILMGYYNFFLVWGLVTLVLWPTRFRRHRWKLTRSFFISSSIKFKLNFWYRNTFCSFLLNFFKL